MNSYSAFKHRYHNQILFGGLLLIIMISFTAPTKENVQYLQSDVKMAAAVDFVITDKYTYYDFCADTLELRISVKSASQTAPTIIRANLNGILYDLTPVYFEMYGLKENDMSKGVTYETFICNPQEGNYSVQYIVGNETGVVYSATNTTVEVHQKNIQFKSYNSGANRIYKNYFQFFASLEYATDCSDVEIRLNILDSQYLMTFNSTENLWIYYLDLGIETSENINYTYTLNKGAYSYTSSNLTVECYNGNYTYFNVDSFSRVVNQTSTGVNYDLILVYEHWENTPPESLVLEINGVNQSLPIIPLSNYYIYIQSTPCYQIDYRTAIKIGPYHTFLLFNTAYNITVYAFNGVEWDRHVVFNNQIFYETPMDFTVELIDLDYRLSDSYIYVDIRLNISTQISNLNAVSPYLFIHSSFMGEQGANLLEEDNSDNDFMDGKIYNRSLNTYQTDAISSGFIELYTKFYSKLSTNQHYIIFQSDIITETYGTTEEAPLSLNVGDYYVYEYNYSYTSGCCHQIISTVRNLYRVAEKGMKHGTFYVAYEYMKWIADCNQWYNPNVARNLFNQIADPLCSIISPFGYIYDFIDVSNPRTFDEKAIPIGKIDDYCDYFNGETKSTDFIYNSNTNSITGSFNYGCSQITVEFRYDSLDRWIYSSREKIINNYMVKQTMKVIGFSSGDLPIDNGNSIANSTDNPREFPEPTPKKLPGYPIEWSIVSMVLGLVYVLKKKKIILRF